MTGHVRAIIVVLAAGSLFAGIATAKSTHAGRAAKPVPLEQARLIVEVNATDGDAGLQVFLDGEPWRSMSIWNPRGRKILDVATRSRVRRYGLTELFSESSEPPFTRFPLSRFKALFPAGRYRFAGRTIEGRPLVGHARLSHAIPDGPEITAPTAGAAVPRGNLVARWNPVRDGGGVRIVGYQVLVEREDPLRTFSVDLPASATEVTVPAQFLEPGVAYKIEVLAIDASRNQTLTERPFDVEPR